MNTSPIAKAIEIAGSQQALAIKIGRSQAAVSKLVRGKSKPSAQTARRIEIATNGQVTRKHLLPDEFGDIPSELLMLAPE